MATVSTLDGM
jgi:hypothetical protein